VLNVSDLARCGYGGGRFHIHIVFSQAERRCALGRCTVKAKTKDKVFARARNGGWARRSTR
jgi:hypothetical protein